MLKNNKKIIYVNDVKSDLFATKLKLKEYYEVYPAQSVKRMFEILERVIPNVILLDIDMTKEESFETISRLKSDEHYGEIPIIFITSQHSEESAFEGVESGTVAFVNRLYSTTSMVEQIGKIINSHKNSDSADDVSAVPAADVIVNSSENTNEERKEVIYVCNAESDVETMKSLLQEHYKMHFAQSIEEMFECLETVTPNAVLLDIKLHEEGVNKTISKLKTTARYSEILVIFLTARLDQESLFKGLNLDVAAYVSKPYSISYLIEQINELIKSDELPSDDLTEEESSSEKTKNSPIKSELVKLHKSENREGGDKPRILAIDDVAVMLRTIHYALHDLYEVYTLTKPEELKNFLMHTEPHLFLLDYNMPAMSGFELVPIIRSYPEHKHTPIIFVTADGTVSQISAALNLGACDFIVKPIKEDVLRKKIAQHLANDKELP